jgi:hypothetical protein
LENKKSYGGLKFEAIGKRRRRMKDGKWRRRMRKEAMRKKTG